MGNSSNHPKREAQKDEYPIVWLDPYSNANKKQYLKAFIQKNKFINLFLKVRCFEICQSFKSFQIILPMNYNK